MKITEELQEEMNDLSNKIFDIENVSKMFLQYLQEQTEGDEGLKIVCFYELFNHFIQETIEQFRNVRSQLGFED